MNSRTLFRWTLCFLLTLGSGCALISGHDARSTGLPTLPLAQQKPLYQTAHDLIRTFSESDRVNLTVPASPEFRLYRMLSPSSAHKFDLLLSMPSDATQTDKLKILREKSSAIKIPITFRKKKNKNVQQDLSAVEYSSMVTLLEYDAGNGLVIESRDKPVMLFVPFGFYNVRAFDYSVAGLTDPTYRQFCSAYARSSVDGFIESLIDVLGKGFEDDSFASLTQDQQELLTEFSAIYLAESYKGILGPRINDADKFAQAAVRNAMLLQYMSDGGKILFFRGGNSKEHGKPSSTAQTRVGKGECWTFFQGLHSSFQRELTEHVISKYVMERHGDLFTSIENDAVYKSENIFETIGLEFQLAKKFSPETLSHFKALVRVLHEENAAISAAVEVAADSK